MLATPFPERDLTDWCWDVAVVWAVVSVVEMKTGIQLAEFVRVGGQRDQIPFPSSLREYSAINDRIPLAMSRTSS
jgi:hypothetical protein